MRPARAPLAKCGVTQYLVCKIPEFSFKSFGRQSPFDWSVKSTFPIMLSHGENKRTTKKPNHCLPSRVPTRFKYGLHKSMKAKDPSQG